MKVITKNFLILLIYTFISIQIISCSSNPIAPPITRDRTTLWQEDIDYLSSQLKSEHLDFSTLIPEQKFNNSIADIKNSISSLQDYEIYIKLQQLIASLKVAHTYITPSASTKYHFVPILTYDFSDGLYIIMTDQFNTNLLGKKILKVGGIDFLTVKDSLKTIISHENNYWVRDRIPFVLSFVEALKYFGFTNNLSEVELELDGLGKIILKTTEQYLQNSTLGFISILDGKKLPLYMENQSSYYWYNFIESNKTLYLKYNVCANAPDKSFADFVSEIQDFLEITSVEKFIIDVRDNSGGSSSVIEPLSFLENSSLNQKGKLFMIIGRHTFSSALLNAISFKQSANVLLLVGEPTGGKPNSYGEVLTFELPNSGAMVRYSTAYFTMMNDDPEALFPDYNIEITSQDFFSGYDPVLEFIINYK